jgi:hypothetical protein
MLLHQTGLLGGEPPVEEIVQPAERLFTGVAVQRVTHEISGIVTPEAVSATAAPCTSSHPTRFDVAAARAGVGFFDQATERRIDEPNVCGIVGVHQLLRMPVHLGATLGTA